MSSCCFYTVHNIIKLYCAFFYVIQLLLLGSDADGLSKNETHNSPKRQRTFRGHRSLYTCVQKIRLDKFITTGRYTLYSCGNRFRRASCTNGGCCNISVALIFFFCTRILCYILRTPIINVY